MFFAHGPISYVLNESIQKKNISKLSKSNQILILIFSILFGILPDIDLALLSLTNIPSFLHHQVFTHSILLYISLWILLNIFIWILKKILNKESRKVLTDELLNVIQWSFLIGTLSHFLADILFSYSITLFPLQTQITILGKIFPFNYFTSYIFTPNFALELLVTLIFISMISHRYIKRYLILDTFKYILLTISAIFLILTMYMNLNTYNKMYHFNNGIKVEDTDYDGIQDRYDSDTDSDGVLNIYEIDKREAVQFVKSISTNTYFVANSKLKELYGAFNSYRLISQTYFEQNLALEPVLREYMKEKQTEKSYSLEIDYPTILYQYFLENGKLTKYENGRSIGDIFFVIEGKEVLNMGIILESNMFGIVLPNDIRLITHTKNDIESIYPNSILKVVSIQPVR